MSKGVCLALFTLLFKYHFLSDTISAPFRLSSYPNRGIRIGDPPSRPILSIRLPYLSFYALVSLLGQILAFVSATVFLVVPFPRTLSISLSRLILPKRA
jgi:hypothetical protein